MTNKRILTLITLLLFLLLVVGCDVIKPNQPPVITSDPVETATVGVTYTYNVVATDPNAGDVLNYSLTTEPEGMLIGESNGKIVWKADDITAAGVGDYDVVVVVSDEGGLSDSQDFTITVGEFVVELIGIEVVPEEMTLIVAEIETFKVTAEYNDDSTADVTSGCVYGISDISIVKVDKDAGEVTALGVGTANISISYTEEGITKGATLAVIVEGTITVRWLSDGVRFYPDNLVWGVPWQDNPIPSYYDGQNYVPTPEPATLILTDGEYHFADANDFYNWPDLPDFEGSVVIDGEGQLTADTTYTSVASTLTIKEHVEGDVEIIIYGEEEIERDHDGTMVGTYTQWGYAFGTEEVVLAEDKYPKAVPAPEQGPGWWFIGYTIYIAHGWDDTILIP